ncbi:hypothetical protein EYZ11_011652 [Aspergillus tanneri]|uniref:Uncharacterized protein n=1 Tax=Aspergillus tanneri TaxID=1220188 RepID=A0A4S3J4F8_9EURO|nr:hypothetical protein EYZ11_011652 [Aspergillus tanneri]
MYAWYSCSFKKLRDVANIFNSAIAAAAIGTAWEVDLLDELRDQKKVDVQRTAAQRNLDSRSVQGLVVSLAVVDVVKRDQDTLTAGRLQDEAYRTKSLFHWLSLGSGGLFSRLQYVLRNKNRTGDFYSRDARAITYACLGVDLAGPVINFATAEVILRGLEEWLSFTEGDARQMTYREEFSQIDLLTCFMMGHYFWPRENCVATLQQLRNAFPNARRFLLGDTTRILLHSASS